jgi:hypothetical protein
MSYFNPNLYDNHWIAGRPNGRDVSVSTSGGLSPREKLLMYFDREMAKGS